VVLQERQHAKLRHREIQRTAAAHFGTDHPRTEQNRFDHQFRTIPQRQLSVAWII